MRLLNTQTLQFEEFIGDHVPKYAILSHRWQEEEISYQHIITGCFSTRKAFNKLQSFCRQAESRGLQYAWIDTCCIDRSSSSELSEAINSMYRWYQLAAKCYVSLFDVGDKTNPDESGLNPLDTSFAKSDWFKRGWTLQELIAPPNLSFFNKDWILMGNKDSCSKLLSAITNIPHEVLEKKKKPTEYVVAQRMSWAASRQTTRVEDRAYSLLGIFGVNIPLLYGEGDNAFLRLQHEVCRTVDDMTFLLFTGDEEDTADGEIDVFAKSPSSFMPRGDFIGKCSLTSRHAQAYGVAYTGEDINGQPFANIEPLTLTNSGITMNLTLVPWAMNTFLAPVCIISSESLNTKVSRYACIFLVRDHSGTKSYRRVKRNGMHYQEALMTWPRSYPSEIVPPSTANWDLAFRERVSIISPQKCPSDQETCRMIMKSLKFTGAKLSLYDGMSRTYWVPSSDDIITRTTITGSETLIPFDMTTYESFAIFRVKRWASWWYICLGLDKRALPICVVTPKLPNQDRLSTTEPSLMSNTDLDLVLSMEACLALAKSEDFSGIEVHTKVGWLGLDTDFVMWRFPPLHINPLDVENYKAYPLFRDFPLDVH